MNDAQRRRHGIPRAILEGTMYEAQARYLLGLREAEALDAERIAAEATRMSPMRCGPAPDAVSEP